MGPDGCFWINNAPAMRGKLHLDLRSDPPPDLALEVHVAGSSLDRMSVYAALGVPEVWRLNAGALTFHFLHGSAYQVRPNSASFPRLASGDLAVYLAQWGQADDTTIVRQFRDWVRRNLLPP